MMCLVLGVLKCFFLVSTLLCKDVMTAPSPLQYHYRCPYNQSEWEDRASILNCHGNDVYHCLLSADKVSVKENCIERSLVLQDRICFGNTDHQITENSQKRDDGMSSLEIFGLVALVIIIVLLLAAAFMARFRFFVCKGEEELQDEAVTNGIHVLQDEKLVFVIGKLGNSVSTIGKNIASGYAKANQMSHKFINYLDIYDTFEFSEKRVYYIDGWFGLWNDNPSEQREVEKSLRPINESSKDNNLNIKIVIGLRSEIRNSKTYEYVFKANGVSCSDQNRTILLDSSSIKKESSVEKHLESIKRNCSKAECSCREIEVAELRKVTIIGTHLTLKILELDHTLADDIFDEHKGPLAAIKNHFKSLKSKNKDLYAAILYIVLKGSYERKAFKRDISEKFNIKKSSMKLDSLKQYVTTKYTLAPMWSSKVFGNKTQTDNVNAVVFWHNFLYIGAFHACYEESDEKEKMLMYCNMDAILQLVRPIGQGTEFTVEADLETISTFYEKRIKGKEIEEHVVDHPLMKYLREKNDSTQLFKTV
uniref:Uncharacterized protein LOC111132831 isoform X2 n=1 Tax=Crassostrea virginica TaxID=6565 RepID=A0A8B8EA85_CRAVI|nr:uncharacterized protein LOC111132831 isoform X2 [Crassostrea virginica]